MTPNMIADQLRPFFHELPPLRFMKVRSLGRPAKASARFNDITEEGHITLRSDCITPEVILHEMCHIYFQQFGIHVGHRTAFKELYADIAERALNHDFAETLKDLNKRFPNKRTP